jgi:hypothetical protein
MRIPSSFAPAGIGLILLAGCGSSTAPESKALVVPAKGEPAAADLCVSSSCGESSFLVHIPDAENILFGPGGRLFVSGGQNVYEVTRGPYGEFAARPLAAQPCNFTGLAIHRNHLYASCGEGPLYAGKLAGDVALAPIYRFEGMCIPNGTAVGPDDRLYVVDEPLNCLQPDPKVVALTLDPADPLKVTAQQVWVQGSPAGLLWMGQDNVLRFPNGLLRDGHTFYGTDGGSVYAVSVGNDGAAGEVTPLFFEETAHDDLALGGSDGLLVTDFFKGRIFLLARDGTLLQQTDPGTFSEPSAVRLGQPPLFERTDILVTDKGVIGEESLPLDGLYLFRRKAI